MVGGGPVSHGDIVDGTDADVLGIGAGTSRLRMQGVVPVPVEVVAMIGSVAICSSLTWIPIG
jgi:hypothetical protein